MWGVELCSRKPRRSRLGASIAANTPCARRVQGRIPLETAEQRANEEEAVEKTTTQMYRAPEMVDLYMERELTEKVDIWVSRPGCRPPG